MRVNYQCSERWMEMWLPEDTVWLFIAWGLQKVPFASTEQLTPSIKSLKEKQ